jgi:hypothetical protein
MKSQRPFFSVFDVQKPKNSEKILGGDNRNFYLCDDDAEG